MPPKPQPTQHARPGHRRFRDRDRDRRTRFDQPLGHHVDVGAQRIELLGVAERHRHLRDPFLDRLELVQQLGVRPSADRFLHLAQLPVPAEHARADAEGVKRRQDARQRQQHGDDGEDRRPHPVDQVRQPER
jgi:hypothetical protein